MRYLYKIKLVIIYLFIVGCVFTTSLFYQPQFVSKSALGFTTNITYYVDATAGNDSNAGTSTSQPWKTIAKVNSTTFLPGDGVLFKRGETWRGETLTVSESGTAAQPIIFGAYGSGDNPVISGGEEITTSWSLYATSTYVTTIPEAAGGGWAFNSLWVEGERAIRAREPEVGGYFLIASTTPETNDTTFTFADGDIDPNWTNINDVEVISLRAWEAGRHKILSITGNELTINGTTDYQPFQNWMGDRYFVENVFEGLDTPGEWYLDTSAGKLYYYPRAGEDINSITIVAPTDTQLVRTSDADYLTFEDITFAHVDWNFPTGGYPGRQAGKLITQEPAIYFDTSNYIIFEDNTVEHVGVYALGASELNSAQLTIRGNTFYDLGAGAIKLGSTNNSIFTKNNSYNQITDNTIHSFGRVYQVAIGIWIAVSGHNVIAHNHVYDGAYSGIQVGWSWDMLETEAEYNLIQYNNVHDVMQELNDGGGIYTVGRQPGTTIQYNNVHDILFTEHHEPAATYHTHLRGIYLDQGSGYMTVRNNYVYRVGNAINMHRNFYNTIENNVFVNSAEQPVRFAARETLDPVAGILSTGSTFRHNVVYNHDSFDYDRWMTYIFATTNLGLDASDDNIFYPEFNTNKPNFNTLAEWQTVYGFDLATVVADPLFTNYASDVFTMQGASPALALGFRSFDVSGNGPRSSTADVDAPTMPANLTADSVSGTTVSLSWDTSIDDTAVSGYRVYDGDTALGTSATGSYSAAGLATGAHTLAVAAYDAAGNESERSYSIVATVTGDMPPTVAFVSPVADETVSGIINIVVNASDDSGIISKVELYRNDNLVDSDTLDPFQFSWDTLSDANGSYSLTAKAYDAAGNTAFHTINVTVYNEPITDTVPPVVAVISPSEGFTLPNGTFEILAQASDNYGVTKLNILWDEQVITTCFNLDSCNIRLNTKKIPVGIHTISAQAYDAAGNVGFSAVINVIKP
ncbi:MAG: Ig-like domain-containing protein [bacterium]|nr:Ig-like domain-containing protein [bacterium]